MATPISTTTPALPHLPLAHDPSDSLRSAKQIILTLRPEWKHSEQYIEFVKFTDGITNTLLKAVNKRPGVSEDDIDREAVLLRAYGEGSAVLIDRNRETQSHFVCAKQGLAPSLYARFDNGLLYKFIPGVACTSADLRRPEISRGIAQRLGQWHARLPISAISEIPARLGRPSATEGSGAIERLLSAEMPRPNMWTVLQKWINALPTVTKCPPEKQTQLQEELEYMVKKLGKTTGICGTPFVFAHCDLLSGNVIIEPAAEHRRSSTQDAIVAPSPTDSIPSTRSATPASAYVTQQEYAACVSFIDYEYATPAPAAFDIANHFAEWVGFECDYSAIPTKSQRLEFITHYLRAFHALHTGGPGSGPSENKKMEADINQLSAEIDEFRGVPGFYWGIWALVQDGISAIDFDYASYAELRFGEYWDWKESRSGSVREKRWFQN
jgi:ethanolamine kinase